MDKNIFSARLRELRLAKGISQSQLANELGAIKQRVNNWETGVSLPPLEMTSALADYFNVSLDYLVGRSDVQEKR